MSSKKIDIGACFANNAGNLLSDVSRSIAAKNDNVIWISRERIHDNPSEELIYNSRDEESKTDALDSLAKDISERGIQSPVKVAPDGFGDYICISGHRRRWANDIAVEKYGYEKGSSIPCIIREPSAVERDFEQEEVILDNLQRPKSDYEHMMEIVRFKECTERRKNLGLYDGNIRDRIKTRLGIGDSEITRYLKIYTSLTDELKEDFRKKNIATTVAFEIAKCSEEEQAYISSCWDRSAPLVFATVNEFLRQRQNELRSPEQKAKENLTAKPSKPEFHLRKARDINDGVEMLSSTINGITSALSQHNVMDKQTQRKVLSKIDRQMKQLALLVAELEQMGFAIDSNAGDNRGEA